MPKISALPAATGLVGTETFPIVQSGVTKTATPALLWDATDVVNVFSYMTAAQIANVRAGTGNTGSTDRDALNTAYDALPSRGGILYIPAGRWNLGTGYVDFTGKSNVTVMGAGMGATILDASAHVAAAYPYDAPVNCGQIPGLSNVNYQTFKDFSVLCNISETNAHGIRYQKVGTITFDSIEISYCGREVLYCDGASPGFTGIKVQNCYFHDNYQPLSACINTNTGIIVETIEIVNNRFEKSTNGMYILGKNIRILGNSFKEMIEGCVNIGESNNNLTESIDSCVVANNTIEAFGTRHASSTHLPTTLNGITSNARSFSYANNGNDTGIVIANNSFKESACPVGTTTRLIRTSSGALVIGNYASGALSTGTSIFLSASFSSDVNSFVGVNSTPVHLYFYNNVLERKPAGTNIGYGIRVLSVDNAYLHMSGNKLIAAVGGQGADIESAANGFLPHISLDGDIFMPTCRLYDLAGSDSCPSTTEPLGIYGTNYTTYRTMYDPDIMGAIASRNLGGSATPDVSKGVWFYCSNAAPQNITDFINAPSYVREITIWFNDANTTVVHNAALIRLNGAVNYVSTVGSSLTLCRPNNINGAWVEKCRSVP